jgi:hypothetical protein
VFFDVAGRPALPLLLSLGFGRGRARDWGRAKTVDGVENRPHHRVGDRHLGQLEGPALA